MMFQQRLINNGFKELLVANIAFKFDWHPGPDVAYEEKPEEPWGILYAIPGGGAIWRGLTGTEENWELVYQVSVGGIGVEQVTALADRVRAVVAGRNELGKFDYDFPVLTAGHSVKDRESLAPAGTAEPQESGLYQLVDRYKLKAGVTL